MNEENKAIVQEAATIIEASKVPVWRLRLLSILQLVGIAAAIMGSLEILNLANILSPEAAKWLTVTGSALRFAAEPLIKLIGDYLDDGVKNDSFKLDQ